MKIQKTITKTADGPPQLHGPAEAARARALLIRITPIASWMARVKPDDPLAAIIRACQGTALPVHPSNSQCDE